MYQKDRIKGTIQFKVKGYKNARSVAVAGDFNGWTPVTMRRQTDGSFMAELAIPPGNHQYKFVIDARWVEDADNPDVVTNRYGTLNSVLVAK